MKRKTKIGKCKLCLEDKELNFEHIPPRSAFNKETRYYSLNGAKYFQNWRDYVINKKKPGTQKQQGGMGDFSFCFECNNFLGSNYVRTYKEFAHIAMAIIQDAGEEAKALKFNISDINTLKFLKQIVAIFIASNKHSFTESYSELLEFVTSEGAFKLNDRFRFYMYLNNKGINRSGEMMFTNTVGILCEFSYPPFGFVLNIDNPNRIMELSEITNFKYYKGDKPDDDLFITLNKYPTYSPFPLDYRSLEEFKK